MLKAVSKMLDIETIDAMKGMERVRCAKIMLDEIIEGMDVKDYLIPFTTTPSDTVSYVEEKSKPTPKVDDSDEKFLVLPDDEMKIKSIQSVIGGVKKELELKRVVEVDGVKMPYSQAKGMSFKQVRIP